MRYLKAEHIITAAGRHLGDLSGVAQGGDGMNRRGFLGYSLAAVGGIFVPQAGRWYRKGFGLLQPEPEEIVLTHMMVGFGPGDFFRISGIRPDGKLYAVSGPVKRFRNDAGLWVVEAGLPIQLRTPDAIGYHISSHEDTP